MKNQSTVRYRTFQLSRERGELGPDVRVRGVEARQGGADLGSLVREAPRFGRRRPSVPVDGSLRAGGFLLERRHARVERAAPSIRTAGERARPGVEVVEEQARAELLHNRL